MQVSRETGYEDLQKLMLKEMASMVAPNVLTSQQKSGELKIRLIDPAADQADPNHYLQPEVIHFICYCQVFMIFILININCSWSILYLLKVLSKHSDCAEKMLVRLI